MPSIQPNQQAASQVQSTSPTSAGQGAAQAAGPSTPAAAQAPAVDGSVLPELAQHQEAGTSVDPARRERGAKALEMIRDLYHSSGRSDGAYARQRFDQFLERGRAYAISDVPTEGSAGDATSSPPASDPERRDVADTQLGRARDVLQRSLRQERTDGAGAREFYSNLVDRARGFAEE